MKKLFLSLIFVSIIGLTALDAASWKPVEGHITTPWAAQVNPSAPLPEYPRPLLQRDRWMNLNGLWEYAVTPVGQAFGAADGQILVPFCIESALSGVGRTVSPEENLWYRRTFSIPKDWKGSRVLLHFGAVDWRADIWVNGIKAGSHTGGYTPFSLDITEALQAGENTLVVKVWDGTDSGYQPRGKQVAKPSGIWYTAVTGIWQTVWMEPVPEQHIEALRTTPDLKAGAFRVKAGGPSKGILEYTLSASGRTVATAKAVAGQEAEIEVADPHLWSPDDPFLYDLEVKLVIGGKVADRAVSYCAMREIGTVRDKDGILRMTLNGKPVFMYGPLDQGWWPDGLYTAPTDEALAFDVQKTRDWGFNMIRKHVKVEPARWYWHCDRLGILVWQDMPSGDLHGSWQNTRLYEGTEFVRSTASEANYRKEWKEIMDFLYSEPCIVVWVPFNEGWGQFKTVEISDWTSCYDPSRLVNSASGGNHFLAAGDILDLHNYPQPEMYLYDAKRVNVLGEYGGIGMPVEGHLWTPDRNWGYIKFTTPAEVTDQYVKYALQLKDMVARGFSSAVYTQTTDVEIEVNGLMTYDRRVDKVDIPRVREVNQAVINTLK
ncbi:MAG: beta galactosidase jelly roll domain-containing protein [Bacteroidales bacterium]|nr:beta galactosidase jelly roll domain-containing protein [Bacteroidales bacterium]